MLVMHAAMMSSVIMYGIVAYMAAESDAYARPMLDENVVRGIAAAVAATCAALSFVLRAKLSPPRAPALAPGEDGTFPLELLRAPHGRAALLELRKALIVTWALVEGVAIAGLVPALLYQDTADYAPFGAAALILLLVHAPRPKLLVEVMKAAS